MKGRATPRRLVLATAACLPLMSGAAVGQQALPEINVRGAHPRAVRPRPVRVAAPSHAVTPRPAAPRPAAPPPQEPRRVEVGTLQDRLLPKTAANVASFSRAGIEALPQGEHAPLDKILLQTPGVTQDSAVGGDIHIRNEHANAQYRVNGVLLPDGVSGFGQTIETGFIGKLSLITGALPAQYGLRTSGVIDIVSRPAPETPSGSVSLYGGSRDTGQTSFDYGAKAGGWEVFASGRLLMNSLGVENPTRSHDAIHDRTRQERFFGFASYAIDGATKLSFITGTSIGKFQIPNTPGQSPQFTAFGTSLFDSARLNENQIERSTYNVVALQRSEGAIDAQLSFFSRASTVHFIPDQLGDVVFNGVASDVSRASVVAGLQGDGAYRIGAGHTLRAGFTVSGEKTKVANSSVLLPLDAAGDPMDAPFGVRDASAKLGELYGVYAQDEWKPIDRLAINAGLRFDQMSQYVSANQLSPRVGVEFEPIEGTKLHAGYARYFTPPPQALAAPTNLALYANTTQQPDVALASAVRPERAHYVDVGLTQNLTRELEVGLGAYAKRARNLLDDGQFGAALMQTAFNYDRAYNAGVEFKGAFQSGDFRAYANLAWGRQRATQITSNQFLFGADELAHIATHYIYTDHAQTWTGSAGASYVLLGTRLSADLIVGGGLRAGFANTTRLSPYTQANLALSRDFATPWGKPITLRFDVVNLLDHAYVLRDGSGIGVFAPQYGPRRGFYAGIRQTF